jgi:hypothetical protein
VCLSTIQGTIVKYVSDNGNGDNENDVNEIQSILGSLSSSTSVVTEFATQGTEITDTIGVSKVGQLNKNVHKVSDNKRTINAIFAVYQDIATEYVCTH